MRKSFSILLLSLLIISIPLSAVLLQPEEKPKYIIKPVPVYVKMTGSETAAAVTIGVIGAVLGGPATLALLGITGGLATIAIYSGKKKAAEYQANQQKIVDLTVDKPTVIQYEQSVVDISNADDSVLVSNE